jgi:predicted membrane-bound mannosyltransferase
MVTVHPFRRSALPIAILLLAFALRLMPWGSNRFLEDEALYAYWGLQIATGADPMLDEEPIDKPPLCQHHQHHPRLFLGASAIQQRACRPGGRIFVGPISL